jgi:hypothetical protein
MFADVTFSTESMVVVGGLLAALVGAMGVLYRQMLVGQDKLLAAKDKEFALAMAEKDRVALETESMKKSYGEIATEAVKSATETTNYYRMKYENKPPLPTVVPVVSESHSPSTSLQRETASIATLRARMVILKEATGQDPREEPPAGPN